MSHQFTGQEKDDESGLMYYGARYYDSDMGRFISEDTAEASEDDPQSLHRYVYCRNNPLKYVDPTGEQPEDFSDVRGAREWWLDSASNKGLLGQMGAFAMFTAAGILQFAQDDAAIMGYHGLTSKEGLKAGGDFAWNSAKLILSVPGVSRALTTPMVSFLGNHLSEGSKILGGLELVSRFSPDPTKAYTAIEPVWVGVQKLTEGNPVGIAHAGITLLKEAGGAHIGLNALGNTHIYPSHVWIGKQSGFGLPLGFTSGAISAMSNYSKWSDIGLPGN